MFSFKKSLFAVLITLLGTSALYSQVITSDKNYVHEITPQVPVTIGNINNVGGFDAPATERHINNVTYFDGLGRPIQQIGVQAAGSTNKPVYAPGWTNDWTTGSGSTGFYNRNGNVAENVRQYGSDPFGNNSILWKCVNDAARNGDGGWNTDYIPIDKNVSYRYSVWVKRTHGIDGNTYHGTQNVNDLNGNFQSNPYFWVGAPPTLGQWYLMVGVIHPYNYTGADTGISGVYDRNGNKVLDGKEFKWTADRTTSRFRSYFYYSTDVNTQQYFWNPVLEQVDGTELSIQQMVNGPSIKDVVTHIEYDQYGRQTKEYLPYATASNSGLFLGGDQVVQTRSYYQQHYPDDFADLPDHRVNPFSATALEASPLNRVQKQAAPGKDWAMGSGHEIKFDYQTNSTDEVRLFTVSLASDYTPTLVDGNSYYNPGELSKTITRDENYTSGLDHTTEEFKDKLGRVVLKRTYESEMQHDTYYVYDDYGNLTYVLPPKVDTTDGVSAIELSELCYQYQYDGRNRLVEKKIPGKGEEYIIYNKLDQPVMTQDANLREQDKWLITKYDVFGRVAFTGIHHQPAGFSRETMQNDYANNTNTYTQYVTKTTTPTNIGGGIIYYTNTAIPHGIAELLSVNYYDDYNFDRDGLDKPSSVNEITTTNNVKGLATGSKVRVLGTNNWITTVTAYDEKGRAIWTGSRNRYLSTIDKTASKLDFNGKALEVVNNHIRNGGAPIITIDRFTYDHAGRLLKQTQELDGNIELIAENTYDELGQLIRKGVGGGHNNHSLTIIDELLTQQNDDLITTTTTTNSWGNSGFATLESISGDGYVEFEVTATNKYLMVGLSVDNPDAHYNTINFAIYPRSGGEVRVYENGSYKGSFDTYVIGDVLRVERVGSTIYYKKNNTTIYTSTISSTATLIGDVAFHSTGSSIKNLKVVNFSSQNFKSSALQNVDYNYNVRGWLKDINDVNNPGNDLFSFKIDYNTSANALFNGNIAKTSWRTANTDNSLKSYDYTYDALNRIKSGISNNVNYDLSNVNYDKNGNILNLNRKGHLNTGATSFGVMDILSYQYDDGNKLTKVTDAGNDNYGFKDGSNNDNDYTYDANGNMEKDQNKGITNIVYNYLSLPTKVTVTGSNAGVIEFIYDATGAKQRKVVSSGTTVDYAAGYIYENGNLIQFSQPEGYVKLDGNGYMYVYSFLDHLGSVRLDYSDMNNDGTVNSSEILQERNTYPFGLEHKGYNDQIIDAENTYQTYLGQETNKELGLNWLTFRHRNYMPEIGRFFGVDPVSADYVNISTYQFAHNNPVSKIELEGLEGYQPNGFDVINALPSGGGTQNPAAHLPLPIGDGTGKHGSVAKAKPQINAQIGVGAGKTIGANFKLFGIEAGATYDGGTTEQTFSTLDGGVTSHTEGYSVNAAIFGYSKGTSTDLSVGENKTTSSSTMIVTEEQTFSTTQTSSEAFSYAFGEASFDTTTNVDVSIEEFSTTVTNHSSRLVHASKTSFNTSISEPTSANTNSTSHTLNIFGFEVNFGLRIKADLSIDIPSDYRSKKPYLHPICFIQGTKIRMGNGTLKNIEDVKNGDYVKSYNEKNQRIENKKVILTEISSSSEFIEIEFENGTKNINTLTHPYFIKKKGWSSYNQIEAIDKYKVAVSKLSVGDIAYKLENNKLKELKIISIKILKKKEKTYNLSNVEDNHNFFANGVLVHNRS
ncbi:DUF6443 domain-containing protein [Spongiivirga citrea]|uniref:AXH domain-containing protein n=1 Tax=Spongiivirga citrea TaxID=1481457 RepID=A0A6M0CL90_9FLAO|nr:DUF6443 domain-containing protein [Spongiivirga citrea]NER16774.1 hypothetical protein [Spongiivirga citrea]